MRRSSCAWDSLVVCRSNINSRRQRRLWAEPESAWPRLHRRARRRQFQTAQRAYASNLQYATQKTLDASGRDVQQKFFNSECETEIQNLVFSVATSFRGIGEARYTSLFQIRTAAEAFSALFREWIWNRYLGKSIGSYFRGVERGIADRAFPTLAAAAGNDGTAKNSAELSPDELAWFGAGGMAVNINHSHRKENP